MFRPGVASLEEPKTRRARAGRGATPGGRRRCPSLGSLSGRPPAAGRVPGKGRPGTQRTEGTGNPDLPWQALLPRSRGRVREATGCMFGYAHSRVVPLPLDVLTRVRPRWSQTTGEHADARGACRKRTQRIAVTKGRGGETLPCRAGVTSRLARAKGVLVPLKWRHSVAGNSTHNHILPHIPSATSSRTTHNPLPQPVTHPTARRRRARPARCPSTVWYAPRSTPFGRSSTRRRRARVRRRG